MDTKYSLRGAVLAGAIYFGAAAVSAPVSGAVITVFSDDLAGWQAAAGATQVVEQFDDATLISGFDITFGSHNPGAIIGGLYRDRAFDTQTTRPQFNFSPGTTAFGGDWDLTFGGEGSGIELFVTFADTSTQTVTTEIPKSFASQFFGIVSDMAIASIRLDQGSQGIVSTSTEQFEFDNARFVQEAAAVPEPATLALLGFGLAGLAWARRRRKI